MGDVRPGQQDPFLPRRVHPEPHVERAGHPGVALLVVCGDALLAARQGDQPVKGPAVEQVEAERGGHPAGDGALAGAAGAVDGDDGDAHWEGQEGIGG